MMPNNAVAAVAGPEPHASAAEPPAAEPIESTATGLRGCTKCTGEFLARRVFASPRDRNGMGSGIEIAGCKWVGVRRPTNRKRLSGKSLQKSGCRRIWFSFRSPLEPTDRAIAVTEAWAADCR